AYSDASDMFEPGFFFGTQGLLELGGLEYRCQTENGQAARGGPAATFGKLAIAAQMSQYVEYAIGQFDPVACPQLGMRAQPARQHRIGRILPLQHLAKHLLNLLYAYTGHAVLWMRCGRRCASLPCNACCRRSALCRRGAPGLAGIAHVYL